MLEMHDGKFIQYDVTNGPTRWIRKGEVSLDAVPDGVYQAIAYNLSGLVVVIRHQIAGELWGDEDILTPHQILWD